MQTLDEMQAEARRNARYIVRWTDRKTGETGQVDGEYTASAAQILCERLTDERRSYSYYFVPSEFGRKVIEAVILGK